MSSPSNPSSHKSTALAANAMIDEGGAISQPSKEESKATLDNVVQKRRRRTDLPSRGIQKGSQGTSL